MPPMAALLSVVPEATMKVEPSEQDLPMVTRWALHRSTQQPGARMIPMVLMAGRTALTASTRATRRSLWLMDDHLLSATLRSSASRVLLMLTRQARKKLDLKVAILAHPKKQMSMDSLSRKLEQNALQS